MSCEYYDKDNIELVQEIVEKIIIILETKSTQIIEQLFSIDLDSFDTLICELQSILYAELVNLYTNLDDKSFLSKNIEKNEREKTQNTIKSGIGTYLSIIVGLFFISKGLTKHGFIISDEYFKLLPYSSLYNIDYNKYLLGIDVIHKKLFLRNSVNTDLKFLNKIPLLESRTFKLGNGACPYTYGKRGVELNKNLIEASLIFLEQLYDKVLLKYETSEFELHKIPDFVKILKGEFDAINFDHLHNNPSIFNPIN